MGVKFRDKSDPDYGYLGPAFIQTNAFQVVSVWALDKNGGYDRQLDVTVTDTGYGFHFARDSRTTHGCGRLASESDALYFAKFVQSNSGIYINVSGS